MTDKQYKSIVNLLQARAEEAGDKVAYTFLVDGRIDKEQNITYAQLDKEARAIAVLLKNNQVLCGEKALLLYPPGLAYISAFFGCLYAGVVAIPAYPPDPQRIQKTIPRLEAVIRDSQAKTILSTQKISMLIKSIKHSQHLKKLPFIGKIASIVSDVDVNFFQIPCLNTEAVSSTLSQEWVKPNIGSDDLAFFQYTSGSTGSPKGVMLTHSNILSNQEMIRKCFRHSLDMNCTVSWLPFYHDMGLIGNILQPLYVRARGVFLSPVDFLKNPFSWLNAISHYQASGTSAPNFGYELAARKVTDEQCKSLDLSSWKVAITGAEAIRPETITKFSQHFRRCGFSPETFYPSYGLAEACLIVTGEKDQPEAKTCTVYRARLQKNQAVLASSEDLSVEDVKTFVSCGQVVSEVEMRIVNPESRMECLENEIGEIWVSGPNIAQGYWQKQQETEATFQAYTASNDGPFLRTGDLGFVHAKELYITGRIKELLIISGQNYFPQDIGQSVEACHQSLRPGCTAVFSVEVQDDEKLVIVAEVRSEKCATEEVFEAIRAVVKQNHDVAVYNIVLIAPRTIPKTSSGKIQNYACREAYLSESLKVVAQQQTKVSNEDVIQTWLKNLLAREADISASSIEVDKEFHYYGIDSKKAMVLTGEIERKFECTLHNATMYEYTSIKSLAEYIHTLKHPGSGLQSYPEQHTPVSQQEPIAIIGIGCRFPKANDPQEFWKLLSEGVDAIQEVPTSRWDIDQYYSSEPGSKGKTYSRWGGFIDNIEQFDPNAFGITPGEAEQMDPQQRILLEVCKEAFVDANIEHTSLSKFKVGVFTGISTSDYEKFVQSNTDQITPYSGTGVAKSIAANRISYVFNLNGPSISIDTACSSSLVAIHTACKSLQQNESEIAIATGANIILSPLPAISFSQAGVLAHDGRCKAFAASADGFVRSEGVAAVILKPLSKALEDKDPIYAVIQNTEVNNNGKSNGLMAPNLQAQKQLIQSVYRKAKILPSQVQYIEAHGTGTELGDLIELKALDSFFGKESCAESCLVGSVKTNIGHLEAAAGIAGLIKLALMIKNKQIPASLHCQNPNSHIDWEETPLKVNTQICSWPTAQKKMAGVSSFGFGGTNAHAILTEPPQQAELHKVKELPIYNKQSYWIAKAPVNENVFVHRLNHYTWEVQTSQPFFDFLQQHRILQHPIWPAAGHIQLLVNIGQDIASTNHFSLSKIEFQKFLSLEKDKQQSFQAKYEKATSTISIQGEHKEVYATSEIIFKETPPPQVDITCIQQACDCVVDVGDIYQKLESNSIHYGVYFQTMEKIFCSKDKVLAQIVPNCQESEAFSIPVTILDGAFQSVIAGVGSDHSVKMMIPKQVDQVTFYRKLTSKVWSYIRIQEFSSDSLIVDLILLDEESNVLAWFEKLQYQPILSTPLQQKGSELPTFEKIRQILEELNLPSEKITPQQNLQDLGVDSLSALELIDTLEQEMNIKLDEVEIMTALNISDLVELIEKKLIDSSGEKKEPEKLHVDLEHVDKKFYQPNFFPEIENLQKQKQLIQQLNTENPYFKVHESVTKDTTMIGSKEYINFASYNYLGLSGDQAVTQAAYEAMQQFGTSTSASRVATGERPVHQTLEKAIANLLKVEDCVVFVSGHATNVTVIGHLISPRDLIVYDSLAHNSIIQGASLSGAQRLSFAHNDSQDLENILRSERHKYEKVLIIAEGVYSMDGDVAPLTELVQLRNKYKALLMIDEAHSIGTIGQTGRGISELFDVEGKEVDLWMGTLSKSFASCGGYIAGSHALVEYLKYTTPGFLYSVGLTPPNAGAALAAIQTMLEEPKRVQNLQDNAALFLNKAKQAGFNTGNSKNTPIIPIITGSSNHALLLASFLFQAGINVQPILAPAVPENEARLRFFITSDHSEEQIEYTITSITKFYESAVAYN